MQLKVRVKEPENVTSRVNQVSVQYDMYERIKERQQGDDRVRRILEKVQGREIQSFTYDKGMLKFGHRTCAPQDARLKEEIMAEVHYTPYTVYPGAIKMYQDLRTNF